VGVGGGHGPSWARWDHWPDGSQIDQRYVRPTRGKGGGHDESGEVAGDQGRPRIEPVESLSGMEASGNSCEQPTGWAGNCWKVGRTERRKQTWGETSGKVDHWI